MHFVVHIERRFLQELGFSLTGAFFIIGSDKVHPHDIGSFPWERIRELHPVIPLIKCIDCNSRCFIEDHKGVTLDKSFCVVKERR